MILTPHEVLRLERMARSYRQHNGDELEAKRAEYLVNKLIKESERLLDAMRNREK